MSARAATAAPCDTIDDAIGGAALPPAPRRLRIGMPQLDLTGLSEGWFLRFAGDLHWEAITRRLGVASDQICDDGDERLYPTVVALRAHYQPSLGAVRENDVLTSSVEVAPCGGACALGRVAATIGEARVSLELLTTFARRDPAGTMRMALPAARHAARWAQVGVAPALAQLARAARRGQPLDDRFAGPALTPATPPLGRIMREPSPYSDYNGARLLYFASYPTLADDAERHLVRRLGLCDARRARTSSARPSPSREVRNPSGGSEIDVDWALATSPTRRDVFYYGNLPLGESLIATLMAFEPEGEGVKTRVRLTRAGDGQPIADVVTRRVFTREAHVR